MWLKLDTEMLNEHRTLYILASGGESSEIATAGVAVVMRHGELWAEIRERKQREKYISRNQTTIYANRWFYVAVVWKLHFELDLYIDSAKKTSAAAYVGPALHELPAHMYIGRPSHVESTHYYGNLSEL